MYGIEGLLAGRTLVDRYLIREVIGRGGMGAVYRAHDQRLDREVAVKVVTLAAPDPEAHARLMARFHREARAAARLHHPNVVAVYDFGRDPALDLDFLVMELLRGEDLSIHIARSGAASPAAGAEILLQAARGLGAGHRAGLIHRDVKPGNLYLEPGDDGATAAVKVLDFGIAEIAASDDATVTHLTVVGRSPYSPAFAAPEQLRGDERLTPAVDVFSLGAVGYNLLTGQRAFTSSDPREMVVEVSRSVAALPSLVPGFPAPLHEVLRRALAPHPDDRFPDAAALAVALEGLPAIAPDPTGRRTRFASGSRAREERASAPAPAAPSPRKFAEARTDFDPGTVAIPGGSVGGPAGLPGGARAPVGSALPGSSAPFPPPPPVPAAGAVPAQQPGPLGRFFRALGNFILTSTAIAAFAAAWGSVVVGVSQGDLPLVYGGAAASVFTTPFAVHRVLRRPGSLRLALFGSMIGSGAAIFFLSRDGELEAVLLTMFLAQVLLASGAEVLSRRPDSPAQSTTT